MREVAEWLAQKWLGEADESEYLAAPVLLLELCKADASHCRSHPSLLALCLLAMQDVAEVRTLVIMAHLTNSSGGKAMRNGGVE